MENKHSTSTVEILFSDASVVVAIKPRGVLSEGSTFVPEDKVATGSPDTADNMPALLFPAYGEVFPVHRLDRGVGGVMVYARTKRAAAALSRAVNEGRLQKEYLAVVSGTPSPAEGELRDYLFKDSAKNKSFVVSSERRGAREAILRYRVTDHASYKDQPLSRVSVSLLTGRSHQIRVQFASRGFPLVGDGKYGSREKAPFPALHAEKLSFPHPLSGKILHFSAPAPADFPFDLFGSSKFEIEHKYLIAYPSLALLETFPHARRMELTQTYLLSTEGETRRVRRVTENGSVRYIYTRKVRENALRALEEEKDLSEQEYDALLAEADPRLTPIEKIRYSLPFEGQITEVDLYPFWKDRAIAEVEVGSPDAPVRMPPFLRILREVSADKRYKNVFLAHEIPRDPLPGNDDK